MSRVVHTNIWSAYGYARKAGYEGTEEEFEQGLKKSAEAAENAEESASTASEAATEADAARDAAAQSAESASTSEGNALEYANSAAQVLRDAQAVAQTVNAKANEAAGSASRAENYAQTATTKASEATTAAGTATTAASSASGSAQAADASATAAAASETNAAASASSASTSAGSASESADEAAASAAAAQEVKDSIPADYTALSDEVTDLKSQIDEGAELIEELQESVLQKKKTILTSRKNDFYVPSGATLVFESELESGFSRANTINFFDATGANIGYKSIATGGKTASYKTETDIYAMQVYYDAEPISVYYITPNLGLIQKVNDLYRYPVASGIKSKNLFTSWEIGGINYTTGVDLRTTDQLRSTGFIEVKSNTEYTASDPDRVSPSARNAQYVIEYDANFQYVGYSTITTTQAFTTKSTTKYIRFVSQYVGTNQYVIGDYENFETMVYEGTEVVPYVSPYPVADRIDESNTAYKMGVGRESKNLFSGSYVYGYPDANGIVKRDSTILTSPFIPITGTVYYQVFGGKMRDVQYIYEYDANKNYIKNSSTGNGSQTIAGKKNLDGNTAFVRFRTQTASGSYSLPTIDFMNTHLVVSDEPIERFLDVKPNVSNDCVDKGFFDTAVQFKGFEYNKSAANAYIDEIQNGAYDVVIPIITDVHSEQPQPYDLHNYIASSGVADLAFNLGDNIPRNYPTREEAIRTLKTVFHEEYLQPRKCEVYVLQGNHDYNPYGNNAPEYTINQALYYSISQARTKKGYADSGKNYGYVDLDAPKVRVIWLDSGDIFDNNGQPITTSENTAVQQEQFTWFCNKALNFSTKANASEWAVMTLSHDSLTSLSDGGFVAVINAFMQGTTAQGVAHCINRGSDIPQAYDVDFTEQGQMEYLCHICGHQHYDRMTLLGNTGRYQIWIACDNIDQGAGVYNPNDASVTPYTRTRGTIEERCLDTFCLDKKNRTITMRRLGIGSDRTVTY